MVAPAAAGSALLRCRFVNADADLHYRRGNELRLAGRAVEAEAALCEALVLVPGHADASLSLAFLLREQGRLRAASAAILVRWQAQPRTRDDDLRALTFLRECQQSDMAEIVAIAALDHFPDDAALLALAGENALDCGAFGLAGERLGAAVERDPSCASAWLRLAHTHRFEECDDIALARLWAARNDARGGEEAQIALCFALGKAHDDLGDFAAAATFWREGNKRAKQRRVWSREGWRHYLEWQSHAAPLPRLLTWNDFAPVFVVGLPRTGTTLVASLLGRHPAVRNRGELNWLAALATRLGPVPSSSALAAAAALYRAQLCQDDAPVRFYLDKNPLNFRHLNLIAAMFPNARIIHCVRDRRDVALSLWSQHFAHDDLAWSYEFDDIAAFEAGYEQLIAQRPSSLAWFELNYEKLVGDSDATLAQLHAFLDLDATEAVEADGGMIRTASVWQARQPLHNRSVGRWRDYLGCVPELGRFSS